MSDADENSLGRINGSDAPVGNSGKGNSARRDYNSDSLMKIVVIVLVSVVLGVAVGCTRLLSWHEAIESAQVMAGIVNYPADNPFYICHKKIWSLFIQLSALGLHSGISERTLAYVISALLSFIAFLGCSLCVFAFTNRLFWALMSPWLLMAYMIDLTFKANLVYPISIAGTHFSYGSLALSTVFLSVALFGGGHNRTGAFLLGLAPAFHVVVGFSAWPLLLVSFVLQSQSTKILKRQIMEGFSIGCFICVASLAVQLLTALDVPGISPQSASAYLDAFSRYWNIHHRPISITALGFWINIAAAIMGFVWLRYYRDSVPGSALLILRSLVVFGIFGCAMAAVTWIPYGMLPDILRKVIPGRFINFNVLLAPAVIIGLLASQRSLISSILLLCFLVLLPMLQLPRQGILGFTAPGLIIVYCLLACLVPKWSHIGIRCNSFLESCFHMDRRKVTTISTLSLIVVISGGLYVYHFHKNRLEYEVGKWNQKLDGDWSNDPFFQRISSTDGMIAVAGIPIFQLRSRRPIALGTDMNMLGYVPECGPGMELILRSVYGLDIFNPPLGAYSYGSLDNNLYRETWEKRSAKQWANIKKLFGVTQVVTPVDWRLHLPEIIKNSSYKAYSIP